MIDIFYDIKKYSSPLLTIAVHNGHETRDEVTRFLMIDEYERLHEEDPYTGFFTQINGNKIIINTSRFEVDVNRPRNLAVYKSPEKSWGLKVWRGEVPQKVWNNSLREYDQFYKFLKGVVDEIVDTWGFIIVYDIHSYNFHRGGIENNPEKNPEINLGTGSMNRKLWKPVINYFMDQLKDYNFFGRKLDVRENIRFQGGHLSYWIHQNYPGKSCVMAIELKKIFMDEQTGAVNIPCIRSLKEALFETIPGVIHEAQIVMNSRKETIELPDLQKRKQQVRNKVKK